MLENREGAAPVCGSSEEEGPREVEYVCTCEDWVEIDARHYKDWLYAQRPLVGAEYGTCWFFLLFSVVGGAGLLAGPRTSAGWRRRANWCSPTVTASASGRTA